MILANKYLAPLPSESSTDRIDMEFGETNDAYLQKGEEVPQQMSAPQHATIDPRLLQVTLDPMPVIYKDSSTHAEPEQHGDGRVFSNSAFNIDVFQGEEAAEDSEAESEIISSNTLHQPKQRKRHKAMNKEEQQKKIIEIKAALELLDSAKVDDQSEKAVVTADGTCAASRANEIDGTAVTADESLSLAQSRQDSVINAVDAPLKTHEQIFIAGEEYFKLGVEACLSELEPPPSKKRKGTNTPSKSAGVVKSKATSMAKPRGKSKAQRKTERQSPWLKPEITAMINVVEELQIPCADRSRAIKMITDVLNSRNEGDGKLTELLLIDRDWSSGNGFKRVVAFAERNGVVPFGAIDTEGVAVCKIDD